MRDRETEILERSMLTQVNKVAGVCPSCGGEMFAGESMYEWEDELICRECLLDELRSMTAKEAAERMNLREVTVDVA